MTSEVHKKFVREPMGQKSVLELAGIGKVLGPRLQKKGFSKAYQVFGQYQVAGKDEVKFKRWLHTNCGANSFQQSQCYACLKEWDENYMQ